MRVVAAVTTFPGRRQWGSCALAYGLFLVCAAPLGLLTCLLRPGMPHVAPTQMLLTALMVFVHPAFVEELIFRVVLLPQDPTSMRRSRVLAVSAAALALYVAAHPLNALLFRPQALGLFESPAYLALAALLGATCTAAYFISRSIWPPVVIHWLTVLVWLWFLGGQALLC